MPKRFLKFSDRWMFNRVLCEKEVCRKVLRAALGIEVGEITYLNAEQAKEPAAASRGVRMDVFAREGSRVFDIEMQVSPEDRIGRRMRYYQAAIDATELGPGEDYELLPESFVVFFCATDPFRAGGAVYSIERVCLEAPGLVAGDDSHWRVFNASAAEDVADPLLWDVDNDVEIPALAKSAGGAKTNNPAVAAFNGIAYTAKFYEPTIEDNVWTGVLDIRTSDYLEATAKDGVSYAQVLASLVPVYFTEVTSSYTLTTTAQITSGSVAMQLTEGGEYTFQDLAGLRASATITR